MRYFWFDFETFPILPNVQAPPPVVMSWAYDDGPENLTHANPKHGDIYQVLSDALMDDDVTMVAHNAAFEFIVTLAQRNGWVTLLLDKIEKGLFTCTMIREKLIRIGRGDHTEGFGLDDCMEAWMLPHVPDKSFKGRTEYGTLWDVPCNFWGPEWRKYALGDLCIRELFRAQETAGPEFLVDQYQQMKAAVSFALTQAWGFPVDPEAAKVLYDETKLILEQYKVQLLRAGLLRAKIEKGEHRWTMFKEAATQHMINVCAKLGREPTRGLPTPTQLKAAYKACEIQMPKDVARMQTKSKVQPKMVDEAVDAGVDEALLQGNIKLDEDACLKTRDELLLAWTRYSQANTLMGKIRRLIRAGRKEYERVQCSYNAIVNTGRSSCRQGEDPDPGQPWMAIGMQMQNLPRAGEEFEDDDGKKKNKAGARECFVAPGFVSYMQQHSDWRTLLKQAAGDLTLLPDEVIVSVDFDAFEMRTWAQCCIYMPEVGFSDLADILNDTRRCPHVEMGTRLEDQHNDAGASWEEIYAWGYGLKKADPKKFKAIRGLAKGPNFGLPGGMGWARLIDYCWLSYGVVVTEAQAKKAIETWKEIYKEAEVYLDAIKERIGRARGARGTIEQFVSQRLRGDVGYCDGANGFFQALAADAAKAAGWALLREAYENKNSPFYGARPLAFVHDEWLYAVKRDRLHDAAFRMRDVQIAAAQRYCPDVILTAMPAAFYRWSKVAGDPVFNSNKELIPYEEAA